MKIQNPKFRVSTSERTEDQPTQLLLTFGCLRSPNRPLNKKQTQN